MKNKNFKLQIVFIFFLFLVTSCIKNNSLNDEEIETKNEETIVSSLSISEQVESYIDDLSKKITEAKTIYEYPKHFTSDEMDGIFFGEYFQDSYLSNKEKKPIEWLVVEKNKNSAILMSKYILNHMPYDNRILKDSLDYFDSNWNDSLVKKWLNNEFYNEAFNEIEKNLILDTHLEDVFGGNESNDKIFIFSEADFTGYSLLKKPISGSRIATKGTEYAKTCPYVQDRIFEYQKINPIEKYLDVSGGDAKIYKEGMSSYWLRTNEMPNESKIIWYNGEIDEKYGAGTQFSYDATVGVRPTLCVKFDSTKYNQIIQKNIEEKKLKEEIMKNRKFDYNNFSLIVNNILPSKDLKAAIQIDDYQTVEFGNYYYIDNEDDRKNTEWIVLDKNEETKEALLLSKNIIDYKLYDEGYDTKVSWDNCSLRKYLNEEFLNKAFSLEEIKIIQPKSIISDTKFATSINTIDRIFCLCEDDCYKYFPEFSVLYNKNYGINIAPINKYVIYKSDDKAYQKNGIGAYWLRDKGIDGSEVCYIGTSGTQLNASRVSKRYLGVGVRPALWVKYQ